MKRTKLLKSAPCEAPEEPKDQVVLKSQIITDGEKQTLNIDIFFNGRLLARYFADPEEDTHWTFMDGKWSACTLENVIRKCRSAGTGDWWGYYSGESEWASKKDEKITRDFLGGNHLWTWEYGAGREKRRKARERKKARIAGMMDRIPAVPEEAEQWMAEEIFQEQYLFVRKGNIRYNYACTACGAKSWTKKRLKHAKTVKCPKCGKKARVDVKNNERAKEVPVVILQAVGDEWVERQFKAACTWSSSGKNVALWETIRAIIPKGAARGKLWYGQLQKAGESQQEFWDTNKWNKRFLKSYLWPGNLAGVLPYGGLEHSGMAELAAGKRRFNVNAYILRFARTPWMEYLVKGRFYKLAVDITDSYPWDLIDDTADNIKGLLKLDGDRVNRLRTLDGGMTTVHWLQHEKKTGRRITKESLEFLEAKRISPGRCEEILEALQSENRMVNYLKKQRMSPEKVFDTWRDYLRMAQEEGMDTTDDIVRLPKDLKARHDNLVEVRNARLDEERVREKADKYRMLDAGILSRLPEAGRYYWEDDDYAIIPAGKCSELMKEGRTLHHCVGASDIYMESMADGRTWILFLRRKKELGKPYYTIEIRMADDCILQWYSEYDRKPDEKKIRAVLDKFKACLKKRRQRAAAST